jgi:hypothetical protein
MPPFNSARIPATSVGGQLLRLSRVRFLTLPPSGAAGERCGALVRAMIRARLIAPASKLATAKALSLATAASSLAPVLGLGEVDADELYAALDWLVERQPEIEAALAKHHLEDGTLVLYDVSSSWLEGRCCELARFGHSRDSKPNKLQIVYGLLCAADGCPLAIAVFAGNTADPRTLSAQIAKLKERFALRHVVLVGDRGRITRARIDPDLRAAGLDWITALRAPAIRGLVEGGALQLSLFDARDMAAVSSPDYPGERLMVCRNPALAAERARKREDLLQATERDLGAIREAVGRTRRPLRGIARIARKDICADRAGGTRRKSASLRQPRSSPAGPKSSSVRGEATRCGRDHWLSPAWPEEGHVPQFSRAGTELHFQRCPAPLSASPAPGLSYMTVTARGVSGSSPEQHSARRLQHAPMISTSPPNTRYFRQPIGLTTSSLPGLNLISSRFRHVMIISGRRRSPSGYQLREVHEVT